ncbi:MAG: cupin domain-containing protein [Proteobacteria bacterium]|nr:cupin domain-containing protein [Pseudomonadota bacterium]
MKNLFKDLPESVQKEIFEVIIENKDIRLERIVSCGHATPPGEWYDQDSDEWVLLLQGIAGLRFEDEKHTRTMNPGDYIHIPARKRHRVEWTDPVQKTIWLALHCKAKKVGS